MIPDEIAHVRRLVVAAHLPYHRLTILHVMPECVVTPFCGDGGGVDTDLVVGSTHHYLFAPVTEDVALVAWCCLGIIVCQRACKRCDGIACSRLIDTSGRIACACPVEGLFKQVSVPVDAEVHVERNVLWNMIVGNAADSSVVAGASKATGIVVAEIAHH